MCYLDRNANDCHAHSGAEQTRALAVYQITLIRSPGDRERRIDAHYTGSSPKTLSANDDKPVDLSAKNSSKMM